MLTYVHENKRFEDFVDFIPVDEYVFPKREAGQEPTITGKLLGLLVLNVLDCFGVATDGCYVMISEKKRAGKEIQSEDTNAGYCACYNYTLNLTISVASTVVSILNWRNQRNNFIFDCICKTQSGHRFNSGKKN
jgi:hypothetical protein